jgi:acetyl esterase/lipase
VVVPIYGRAPAYTYKDLIPLMDHAFVNMSREHPQRDVILCGDSSGGNAIMMLSNRIPMLISQNAGVSAPICSVLISPWADPCGTNAEAWNLRKSDPLLHASAGKQAIEWFSNGENLLSTPLCPMIDDSEPFRNYSYPFILITGTCEMLNADHRAMKHKAAQAGVTCYFLEYEELMHDFPVIPFLPESHEVLQTVAQILKHTIPSMVDGKL